jgi:hypothetical protein
VESTERHRLTALIRMTSGQDGKVQAEHRRDPHAKAGDTLTPGALCVGESPRSPIRGAASRCTASRRSRGAVTGRPINQAFRIGPGVRAAGPCSILKACLHQDSLQIRLIERIWKNPRQPRINLLALFGTDMEIVPPSGWPRVSASVSCTVKHCHHDLFRIRSGRLAANAPCRWQPGYFPSSRRPISLRSFAISRCNRTRIRFGSSPVRRACRAAHGSPARDFANAEIILCWSAGSVSSNSVSACWRRSGFRPTDSISGGIASRSPRAPVCFPSTVRIRSSGSVADSFN